MADVYEQSYCHLVWATTRREAMISLDVEKMLYDYIRQKCREKKHLFMRSAECRTMCI